MRVVLGSRRGVTGRGRLVAVVVALGLSAVACQSTAVGETSTAGVADVPAENAGSTDADTETDSETDADTESGEAPTEADFEEAQLAFEQCMADAGFEFETNGGAMAFESQDEDFEAMDAAMQECSAEAFGEDGLILQGSSE